MNLADVKIGQHVRWRTVYGTRTGQVYRIKALAGFVVVDYFASLHGGLVRQEFLPESLEAVERGGARAMILRAWSGSLIDTAEYSWTVWLRWMQGWVRYALDRKAPRRCRARHALGYRCWERRGHRRLHGHQVHTRAGDWLVYRWIEVEEGWTGMPTITRGTARGRARSRAPAT